MARLIARTNKFQKKAWGLRDFHQKRNCILIRREIGGAGDILMHRMLFEDFKKYHQGMEVHFSCPERFHGLVEDHPYIDKLLDSNSPYQDYVISYNTSSACAIYEMAISPKSNLHRSDIWANHCGFNLANHNMHINLNEETIRFGERCLSDLKKDVTKPAVLIAPISAMSLKDLNDEQLTGLVEGLRMRGCFVYASHIKPINLLKNLDVPVVAGISMKNWMGVVNSADYVVSVDSGCFHLAGGLKKPLVGIFTFADGKVYSRHFSTVELVQKHRDNGDWDCGPCYNAAICPKSNSVIAKPCLTELSVGMIMDGVDRMFDKFPWDKRFKKLNVIKC